MTTVENMKQRCLSLMLAFASGVIVTASFVGTFQQNADASPQPEHITIECYDLSPNETARIESTKGSHNDNRDRDIRAVSRAGSHVRS